MPDLRLEREFPVSPETLFTYLTTTDGLLQWWGHDGMTIPEHNLDFSRPGPWFSVMLTDEGNRMKLSGQVTHVDPPRSVGFTWGWHDPQDVRGPESHVTLTVSATETGARLVLDHVDLPDAETVESHGRGWAAILQRLARIAV